MTLTETKIRADNGDTNAMMALVKHYFQDSDNDESYELGRMYQERAANAGNLEAISQIAHASYKMADIMMTMLNNNGRDDSWVQAIEESYKHTLRLVNTLKRLNIHGDAAQAANTLYLDSIVWLSTVYLLDENYQGIIRITQNVPSPVAKVLYGRALYELAETNAELENAFSFLRNALHPSFLSDRYSTPRLVEAGRVETCSILSVIYRSFYEDDNSAYNVLLTLLNNTKDAEFQKSIRDDMSRYRKTLFGGYKYIG